MGTPTTTTELRKGRTFEELQQGPPHRSSDLLARLGERRTQDRNAKRGEQVWNHIYMSTLSLSLWVAEVGSIPGHFSNNV